MWKNYKAIFFDWDGTAVLSRTAPADEAADAMRPLLEQGVKLAIISGTTIENIAGGNIYQFFTESQSRNLFLGLGRGAYNYSFQSGRPQIFADQIPEKNVLEDIHRICFDIHLELKHSYDYDTDIVFSRPNYCKIDLMTGNDRGNQMFMQAGELERLKENLENHGIHGGLRRLIEIAKQIGEHYGISVKPTCDAKYLEVGISDKGDNVDRILEHLTAEYGISPEECCYWGDEFVGVEPGIYGSDSLMCTEKTGKGDFFDVSELEGDRLPNVNCLGGGVETFLEFLKSQGREQ